MKRLATLLFLILPLNAYAEGSRPSTTVSSTKATMKMLLDRLVELKTDLVSESRFQDPKNSERIARNLGEMTRIAREAEHDRELGQENFKFSRRVLEDRLEETERVFRVGNREYARWMVNSTISLCMGCHTQGPMQSRQFGVFLKPDLFESRFDEAEFRFAIQDFDRAIAIYEMLIRKFPESKIGPFDLETSVKRLVGYDLRIKRDPAAARKRVLKLAENSKLPPFVAKELKAWARQLERWEKVKIPNVSTAPAAEVLAFARRELATEKSPSDDDIGTESRMIGSLIVSGVLFGYLKDHSDVKEVPEFLLELARCDRELSNTFFYSLADLYLRECIFRFASSAVAAKCYREFEENALAGFTGSSGTNLPPEVTQELARMKKKLQETGVVPADRPGRN